MTDTASSSEIEALRRELLLRRLKASHAAGAAPAAPEGVTPRDRTQPVPLSQPQLRLWFLSRLDVAASVAYHMPLALELEGRLNLPALRAALDRIVARHEILRTTFPEVNGQAVQQVHAPSTGFLLRLEELSGQDPHAQAQAIAELAAREVSTPFDLERGPLLRACLVCIAPDRHRLYVTQHHIISDGWSIGLLVRELSALYTALVQDGPDPLPALTLQYSDYAAWQHRTLSEETQRRHADFWRSQLDGVPTLLSLPTDRPRPPVQSHRGGQVPVAIDAALATRVRALSRRHGLTPFMTLLAAWSTLLSRLSGQDDLVVGTAVANRRQAELEPLIGFFVNSLALRVRQDGETTVAALLAAIKATTLAAYDKQDLPFERVVEAVKPMRGLGHNPLFQAHLVLENVPTQTTLSLPGLTIQPITPDAPATHYDISLALNDTGAAIDGHLVYATDLFDHGSIERIADQFVVLLAAFADSSDEAKVADLPWLSEAQRRQVVHDFNASELSQPPGRLVHQQVELQARLRPDAVAVVHRHRQLSYAELNARANQLAHRLIALGVRPDERVAICIGRSVEMVVGLLATLKAGAAYVPVDPSYPVDRVRHMLDDSAPVAVLTHRELVRSHALSALLAEQAEQRSRPVVVVDDGAAALDHEPDHDPDPRALGLTDSHLAYVIYTSGSTGRPKGVMIHHAAWINFHEGVRQQIYGDLPTPARVAQNAAFSFDGSIKGLSQLMSGHCVVIVPAEIRASGAELLAFLRDERIDVIDCTPLQVEGLVAAGVLEVESSLKRVLIGGESIAPTTWEKLRQCRHIEFHNMYGPTECTVDVTCGLIPRLGALQSTGSVMPNARVYVLDRQRRPVPVGVVGEVHLSGRGLARGYLHRPDLTADRFITLTEGELDGVRVYRTGDLGCWLADGSLRIVGRNDFQVKVRGFRIELGEIEGALLALDGVQEAVVTARGEEDSRRLVAYVVAHAGAVLTPGGLRDALAQSLPDHMLPSACVILPALPRTPIGKLDRTQLPEPDSASAASRTYAAPESPTEAAIANLWASLLNIERVGRHDDFFDLGGHSILGVRMLYQVRLTLGTDLPLRTLFRSSTVAALAGEVLSAQPTEDDPHLVVVRAEGARPPLFLVHPGGGEMYYARNLAPHLAPDQPVYGLAAVGFREGEQPPATVQQMARSYLESVRRVQPTGPVHVAGWSTGGVVAYEMTRQLLGADQPVGFLGLIDSTTTHGDSTGDRHFNAAASQTSLHAEQLDEATLLLSLVPPETPDAVFAPMKQRAEQKDLPGLVRLCQHAGLIPPDVGLDQVARIVATRLAIKRAAAAYRPAPLPLAATMFVATDEVRDDPTRGWSALLGPRLTQVPVEGDHYSLVEPAHVPVLGRALQRALDLAATSSRGALEPLEPVRASYEPRISLQTGRRGVAPLFCIPGAGANVMSFHLLADALGADTPVHGLQPRGLDGRAVPHTDVRAAALAYLPSVLEIQPVGPIHLAGHSFGAWVAHALANELAQRGHQVMTVVAIDSKAPSPGRAATRLEDIFSEFVSLYEQSAGKPLALGKLAYDMPMSDRLGLLLRRLVEARVLPASTQLDTLRAVWNVFETNVRTDYTPKRRFDGRFCLAQTEAPSRSGTTPQDNIAAWRAWGSLDEVWQVPGNHMTVLAHPHVHALAGRLREAMAGPRLSS